jgi:hypothetical protein
MAMGLPSDPLGHFCILERWGEILAGLASAASYRLAEARLELLDATGSVILALEPAP